MTDQLSLNGTSLHRARPTNNTHHVAFAEKTGAVSDPHEREHARARFVVKFVKLGTLDHPLAMECSDPPHLAG
jgi:hypothetical protein